MTGSLEAVQWILVAILVIGDEQHKLQELYETFEECEARAKVIDRAHRYFFHDDPQGPPPLQIECRQITVDSI